MIVLMIILVTEFFCLLVLLWDLTDHLASIAARLSDLVKTIKETGQ